MGWPLEALTARPLLAFVHPDDRTATQREVDKLAAGIATRLFENRCRHQDGSYRWLQWNAQLIAEHQLIYATARDITRQKWLEREIIEIADREKDGLGRDLHDGLCQSLAGIAALSATFSRTLAANAQTRASKAAAEITGLLNNAIGEARDMARGVGPVGLMEMGLCGALEALALTVQQRFRVACAIESDRSFPRLGPEVEKHLFRLAQEAVNNAVAHGRATQIKIGLRCEDGHGVLSVRDDGIGVSDQTNGRCGVGLHTMAYRARLFGGFLAVRRDSPRGTVVTCGFALPASPGERETPDHVRDVI